MQEKARKKIRMNRKITLLKMQMQEILKKVLRLEGWIKFMKLRRNLLKITNKKSKTL